MIKTNNNPVQNLVNFYAKEIYGISDSDTFVGLYQPESTVFHFGNSFETDKKIQILNSFIEKRENITYFKGIPINNYCYFLLQGVYNISHYSLLTIENDKKPDILIIILDKDNKIKILSKEEFLNNAIEKI